MSLPWGTASENTPMTRQRPVISRTTRNGHSGRKAESPLQARLRYREEFFCKAGIDPRQFLQAFDHVPGLYYFVKDAESRTLLNTRERVRWAGEQYDLRTVGKKPREYLEAKDLARALRAGRSKSVPHRQAVAEHR